MDYLKENLKSHLTINLDEKESATLLADFFHMLLSRFKRFL